jgi:hypothetical protein
VTEFWRVAYAVLAFACSCGFTTTLYLRWVELERGERILRCGLILEHLAFVYGAYYALHHGLPGNVILPVVVLSMLLMLLGFLDWFVHGLMPAYRRGSLVS